MCKPYQCQSGQYCKVVDGKATCVKPECSSGKKPEDISCCKPGYYGDNSDNCKECPSYIPSSSFSAPNKNCECPNLSINNCFACTNKCRPYDPVSKMCRPYECPSGKLCKVKNNQATCV